MRKLIGRAIVWFIRGAGWRVKVIANGNPVVVGEFIEHTRADITNIYQELLLAHKEIEKLNRKRDAHGRFVKGGEA